MADIECEYPYQPPRHYEQGKLPLLQPSASVYPVKPTAGSRDIDLFGMFRTETANFIGGPFMASFWTVDVVRACQAYPALWHASIALSAVHQSVKLQASISHAGDAQLQAPQNRMYIVALTHFNKSIRSLADALSRGGSGSYMDHEMVIMANILYIGICNVLRDNAQADVHGRNLIYLLQRLQFVKLHESGGKGIMPYSKLMAVVLALTGSTLNMLEESRNGKWPVSLLASPVFSSTIEAYMEFLPLQYPDYVADDTKQIPLPQRERLSRYVRKLDAFEASEFYHPASDGFCMSYIRLMIRHRLLVAASRAARTRSAAIKEESKANVLLDEVDALLEGASVDSESNAWEFVTFSPSLRSLLFSLSLASSSAVVRRKGTALMRKWPYKDGGTDSRALAAQLDVLTQWAVDAPQRSLEKQRAGFLMTPWYPNGGLTEGEFDGRESCECIRELYVCRWHRLSYHKSKIIGNRITIQMINFYELRHEMEYFHAECTF